MHLKRNTVDSSGSKEHVSHLEHPLSMQEKNYGHDLHGMEGSLDEDEEMSNGGSGKESDPSYLLSDRDEVEPERHQGTGMEENPSDSSSVLNIPNPQLRGKGII